MYTKEVLVKLIKKARQLHRKGLSQRAIAQKMKVSKDSVGKWLKMQFDEESKIKDLYKEQRGFKKGVFRKYNKTVCDRIEDIYEKMVEEKKFFINKYTILQEYKHLYGKDKDNPEPTLHYVGFVQKQRKLYRRRKKVFRAGLSKYMHYPEVTINALGYIMEGIDFVGPRYLKGDSEPYHFLSRRYNRPEKYGKIDIITGQTTEQTICRLVDDWSSGWPLPDVMKIDNDSAFGMLKSTKTENCIGGFTKRLLHLGITPLYSIPRGPWNNGSVEGQNSVFNELFWQQILFDSPTHLRTEIKRFNMEYEQYSELINTTKEDMKKLHIKPKYLEEMLKEKGISKEDITCPEYTKKLKKEDFHTNKICILRKTQRVGEKGGEEEKGSIELLGNTMYVDKKYINTILFCELDTLENTLKIGQEIDGILNNISTKKFTIKNI